MTNSITDKGKNMLRKQPAQETCPHENQEVTVHQGVERSVCTDCRHVTFKSVGPSTTEAAFQSERIHTLMLGVEPDTTLDEREEIPS